MTPLFPTPLSRQGKGRWDKAQGRKPSPQSSSSRALSGSRGKTMASWDDDTQEWYDDWQEAKAPQDQIPDTGEEYPGDVPPNSGPPVSDSGGGSSFGPSAWLDSLESQYG